MVEIDQSTQIGIDGERYPIGDLPTMEEVSDADLFEGGLVNWADYFSAEDDGDPDYPVEIGVALSDETTAITTGTGKATIRAPFAFTLTDVRASLTTVSSSGTPTVNIKEGGVSILSTKLTIDASEKTSTTAAAAAVISDSAIADDAELTFDIDVAGTGAAGLKVWLIGTRVLP